MRQSTRLPDDKGRRSRNSSGGNSWLACASGSASFFAIASFVPGIAAAAPNALAFVPVNASSDDLAAYRSRQEFTDRIILKLRAAKRQ
jgi:hypothetical protein